MPVTTRSQSKNLVMTPKELKESNQPKESIKLVITPKPPSKEAIEYQRRKSEFVYNMKQLLAQTDITRGKENKMKVALNMYRMINEEFPYLFKQDKKLWIKFAATLYLKAIEFENLLRNGDYLSVDKKIVDNFFKEVEHSKQYTIEIIKKYSHLNENHEQVKLALKNMETTRPRRLIPRVNYTGMDCIEPESEYDGITDIWADNSKYVDSDYEPSD